MNYIEARQALTKLLWDDGNIYPEEVLLLELLANILGNRIKRESRARCFLRKCLRIFRSVSYCVLPQKELGRVDIVIADTPSRKAWRAVSKTLTKAVVHQDETVSASVVLAGNSKFQKVVKHQHDNVSFIRLSPDTYINRTTYEKAAHIVNNMLGKIRAQDDHLYTKLLAQHPLVLSCYTAEFHRMISVAEWLKQVECKAIVVQTEHQFSHYVSAAHLAGCKVFQILHGTPSPLYWPFISDKTWVWGRTTKQYFENLGCHPNRLEIIGNLETELNEDIMHQGTSGKKNLLFFSQLSGDRLFNTTVFSESLNWLKAIMEKLPPDWTLTVRMHPVDDEEDIRKVKEIFSFLGNKLIISRTNSMDEDIGNATIACTCSSTAILASLAAKTPSFVLWSSGIEAINGSPILPDEVVIKNGCNLSAVIEYRDQNVESVLPNVLANRGHAFEIAAKHLIKEIKNR